MVQPMSTGCNHTFCASCILQALDRRNGCPMCKVHITKRGLNRVDHLEQLTNAFLQLKEAFELEDGVSPRTTEAEPMNNLTQLFPYPEKSGELSDSDSRAQEPAPVQAETNFSLAQSNLDIDNPPAAGDNDTGAASSSASSTHSNRDNSEAMDLDCFDMDLDTVSPLEAALIAERMMALMALVESRPLVPTAPSSAPNQPLPSQTKPEQQPELTKVKQEQDDTYDLLLDHDIATQAGAPALKEEPTITSVSQNALLDSLVPTQEPALQDVTIILCGTFMSASKKQQMETIAKTLRAQTTDDISTRPTHVVMDITPEQSRNGSGRTIKYILGVLRSCWVLRYEWLSASLEAGYWVEEAPYQLNNNEFGCSAPKLSRASALRGELPLFANVEVQLFGTFHRPSKEEVEVIVRAGGGTVVSRLFLGDAKVAKASASRNAKSDSGDAPSSREEQGRPERHFILYDQSNDGVMSLKRLRTEARSMREMARSLGKHAEIVQCKALFDCVAQYDLSKLVEASID
ncbi:BRCA1-associated RING domain protein 1 [Dissophora globulifera]|nr:BRCA1-associated RING domain protein 1 [Dissophora globulifera]